MKVLGRNKWDVIVELSFAEWIAIGGAVSRDGYSRAEGPDITKQPPDVCQLVKALEDIARASPDLERIRATFQTFLLLTDPAAIGDVLKKAGVPESIDFAADTIDVPCDTSP